MSTPPPFVPVVEPVPPEADFGPDFTQTPPRVNQKNPPKSSPFRKIGLNKKARSPIRKLTAEDVEQLAKRYRGIGNMAKPFHPKFAQAMVDQSDECAEAWLKLTETNDTVRRWVLGFIEGGALAGVIAAHTPIFLAVIPEETLNRLFLKGMGLFAQQANEETDSEEQPINGNFAWPTWGSKPA